ncbi:histidine phosphatase family protein [Clostridium tertium]|uniref:histidine phosphatase family protein n=1 Tax=Clostridium tertium TaxID=1559 RepID=UPI0024B39A35|nr:histidine phosphatase family protein [Clostridium tertium]MDI9218652.1 phosphoglycerate mutase family protein [Clostridium tertium]
MSSMEVYLFRHGKTICNEKRLYCGKTDISLSDRGIEELNYLKSRINYPKCDKYFTSGAARANETFNIIYKDEAYEELSGFFEYDFGDFEMKSYEDLKEDKLYINWIMDEIGEVRCPNGESKNQYKNRIKEEFISFIKYIKKNEYKSVLLISHGGTIGSILECFYDDSKNFYSWQPKCGEGYKLKIEFQEQNFTIKEVLKIKS